MIATIAQRSIPFNPNTNLIHSSFNTIFNKKNLIKFSIIFLTSYIFHPSFQIVISPLHLSCSCTLSLFMASLFWMLSRPGPQSSTSRALTWIQCKLGKQYLEKKFTLPWESNPGPTPNRGDLATLVASVGYLYGRDQLNVCVCVRHGRGPVGQLHPTGSRKD